MKRRLEAEFESAKPDPEGKAARRLTRKLKLEFAGAARSLDGAGGPLH